MPKKNKQEKVYEFLLEFFKNRYEERHTFKRKTNPDYYRVFEDIESIIDFVLDDDHFIETEDHIDPEKWQTCVSRGLIRLAVNELIEYNRIAMVNGSYEFVPQMDKSVDEHPILQIAHTVDVSICRPDEIMVLSVAPENLLSVTNYLKAVFYKGDIIFIPIVDKIICVSILPKRTLFKLSKDDPNDIEYIEMDLQGRIHTALKLFNFDYPDFPYGEKYETEYYLRHDKQILDAFNKRAKKVKKEADIRPPEFIADAINAYLETKREMSEEETTSEEIGNAPNNTDTKE